MRGVGLSLYSLNMNMGKPLSLVSPRDCEDQNAGSFNFNPVVNFDPETAV